MMMLSLGYITLFILCKETSCGCELSPWETLQLVCEASTFGELSENNEDKQETDKRTC